MKPKIPTTQRFFAPLIVVLAVFTKGGAAFAFPAARFSPVSSLRSDGGEAATAPVDESSVAGSGDLPQALIFDCDGVLADTERDGHRPAFNAAFKIKNLGENHRACCTYPRIMFGMDVVHLSALSIFHHNLTARPWIGAYPYILLDRREML